jgi:hypothetical protein
MRSARPASTSTAPPLRLTRATGRASASFKRAAELFTGTVGQGSHFAQPADRHGVGAARRSGLPVPVHPAADQCGSSRRGTGPRPIAPGRFRRRRRRPLLCQGLCSGDCTALDLTHAAARHQQPLQRTSGLHREFVDAINMVLPDARVELPAGRSPAAPARDPYLDISRLTRPPASSRDSASRTASRTTSAGFVTAMTDSREPERL